MNARNGHETANGWATGLRAATLIVVVGTLAAAWYPMDSHQVAEAVASAATEASAAAPDMSVYFPARVPARENMELHAPAF